MTCKFFCDEKNIQVRFLNIKHIILSVEMDAGKEKKI